MTRLLQLTSIAAALALAGCSALPPRAGHPAVDGAVEPAPGVVAAGRLVPADVQRLRQSGIRQVVDLTLDAETPDFDEANAMRAAGIEYTHLPLAGASDLTEENVRRFDAMLRDAQRPVLVHCASGNRVGAMAALRAAWVQGMTKEESIAVGRAWGLTGLEAEVRRRIAPD